METIYLVGQISPKFEVTYLWRKKVREILMGRFHIIDPCSNSFNKDSLKENEYAITKTNRVVGIDLLVPKDLTYVKRSDIAIVNMNQYDPDKPLLGSFFELAWYYMYPEKAVIAFADDLNDYKCQHPFVQQAVNTWCRDEDEACDLVLQYFIRVESC
jgi:hypothetical protein